MKYLNRPLAFLHSVVLLPSVGHPHSSSNLFLGGAQNLWTWWSLPRGRRCCTGRVEHQWDNFGQLHPQSRKSEWWNRGLRTRDGRKFRDPEIAHNRPQCRSSFWWRHLHLCTAWCTCSDLGRICWTPWQYQDKRSSNCKKVCPMQIFFFLSPHLRLALVETFCETKLWKYIFQ